MITLVGVGHVFAISENVKEVIRSRRPALVCLELDPARYHALTHKGESRDIPIQYILLAKFQKRMAGKFGTEVGDEMLAGAEGAREVGAKLALIDMDAATIFGDLWRRMSFREKVRLMGGALVGLVSSKKMVEKEIENYSNNDARYIEQMGEGFPVIKEVLIDRRNAHMARQITTLAVDHPNMVVIVGDGHVPGLVDALKGHPVETVRLKQLREGSLVTTSPTEYTVTYEYR